MVGMVVGTFDGEYKVQGGAITLAINEQDASTRILLKADSIDIDGFIEKLETKSIMVADFNATDGEFTGELKVLGGPIIGYDYVQGTQGKFGSLNIDGDAATWRSKQISTPSYGTRRYFLYAAQSGSTTPTGTTQHYPITSHSEVTIHYLGGAETQ